MEDIELQQKHGNRIVRKIGHAALFAVLVAALLAMATGAAWAAWQENGRVKTVKHLRNDGVRAQGVILAKNTALRSQRDGNTKHTYTVYRVKYQYESPEGEHYTETVRVSRAVYGSASAGDSMAVYFDPLNPGEHITEYTRTPDMMNVYYLTGVSIGLSGLLVVVIILSVGIVSGRLSGDDVLRLLTIRIGGGADKRQETMKAGSP